MGVICRALNLSDAAKDYLLNVGESIVYDQTRRYLDEYNAMMEAALAVFVQGETEDHKTTYELPMGGMLQPRRERSRSAAQAPADAYDVAYPLNDFGAEIAVNDIALKHMTVQRWDNVVEGIINQDKRRMRYELMRPMLNNAQRTVIDDLWGTLTVDPIANGDSVLYPPKVGSEVNQTLNHFIESNYLAANISDVNNPFATIADMFKDVFGSLSGNENIVAFINKAQSAKTRALTNFVEVEDSWIRSGVNTAVPFNLPSVPGTIIGRTDGVWVSEWSDGIPANYISAVHLNEPQPLKMRIDLQATGLGKGLQMVAKDENHPFNNYVWRHRYGFGPADRRNGITMELATGGTYTVPSGF
jgi:hypothetical protein